jgi:hypothetical protein
MVHQGQSPQPSAFRFFCPYRQVMGITTLSTLLHFASDEKHADKHILGMHQELADALPDGVVPIAIDPCGSMIAFDFRVVGKLESATGPFVVLLDLESRGEDGTQPSEDHNCFFALL